MGDWIVTKEQLPIEPVKMYDSTNYLATVVNNQVVPVRYVKTTLRGKEIVRWEWNGRICPWEVIAWLPFPKAYGGVGDNV